MATFTGKAFHSVLTWGKKRFFSGYTVLWKSSDRYTSGKEV